MSATLSASPLTLDDYEELRSEAERRGLFKRTLFWYGLTVIIGLIGMGATLYAVTLTDNALFQFFNAIVFGFFSVQIGIVSHDLSHGAVFHTHATNRIFASMTWGFLGGLSELRWFENHNKHHEGPNHIGHDPDLHVPFMFSEKELAVKSPFLKRWVLPYQHILFWPALSFVYPLYIWLGMRFHAARLFSWSIFEVVMMAVHFAVVFYVPFAFLPFPVAVLFVVVAFITIGIYMGFAFAPNHKGRTELAENEEFHWTDQITHTRNLRPSWIEFYLFGGLNFQIEHHLFPMMSRFKYPKAHLLVKEFCAKHNLPYHETSWPESLQEMYAALRHTQVVAGVRVAR